MSRWTPWALVLTVAFVASVSSLHAQTVDAKPEDLAKAREKGVNFLKTSQANDGSWTSPESPGVSGLVVYSLLLSGTPASDPVVEKGLKHLSSFVQQDGG